MRNLPVLFDYYKIRCISNGIQISPSINIINVTDNETYSIPTIRGKNALKMRSVNYEALSRNFSILNFKKMYKCK